MLTLEHPSYDVVERQHTRPGKMATTMQRDIPPSISTDTKNFAPTVHCNRIKVFLLYLSLIFSCVGPLGPTSSVVVQDHNFDLFHWLDSVSV